MDPLALLAGIAVAAALLMVVLDARRRSNERTTVSAQRVLDLRRDLLGAPGESTPSDELGQGRRRSLRSRLFARPSRIRGSSESLERAGLRWSQREFFTIRLVAAFAAFVVGIVTPGGGVASLLLGLTLGAIGFLLPSSYVDWRGTRRSNLREAQLPDMLSLVANSVRSGFALLQAFDNAVKRIQNPLKSDLEQILSDVRLGRPIEDSMRDWVRRSGSRDVQLVVTAILVQRGSGGNLSEVLDNLAATMRERIELRQQVRTLTAYPRLAAKVIAAYPLIIVLIMTAMRPDVWLMLWTESAGYAFLAAAGILNVTAFLMMRRIVRVDF